MASISSRSSRSSPRPDHQKTYIFNGTSRTLVKWSDHTKDRDLWLDDGDCLIQLAPFPASQSPQYALRVSIARLQASKNEKLLSRCHDVRDTINTSIRTVIRIPQSTTYAELSLPHELTTRNYFAYLSDKPLVSTCLGHAMVELWDRVQEWHPEDGEASQQLIEYFRKQGYLHAANNPHAACASLALADHARHRALWVNAFTHCVAMYSRLDAHNPEYSTLSNRSKALITKAALEMETRVGSFTSAVGTFLEDDFGTEQLGLAKAARDHLDRFRSCLQSFFVEKLDYFPPSTAAEHFDVASWDDIRSDFQSLYEYLVDKESSKDLLDGRSVNGGVCVHQNVQAFNSRHSFSPLPHPLPLMPSLTPIRKTTESQVSLRNFKLIRLESDFRPTTQESLTKATNSGDEELLARPIVREYISFEGQRLLEKLSIAEARKVRWLLIYGCLQMLNNVLVPPPGVEYANECEYPLCASPAFCPFPEEMPQTLKATADITQPTVHLGLPSIQSAEDEEIDRVSIHPDLEADNAHDYFTLRRTGSELFTTPTDNSDLQQHTSLSLSRTATIRTSVQSSMTALSKSVVGSLARRNSFRRSVQLGPRKMPSLCDIVVESTEAEPVDTHVTVKPMEKDLADFDFGLELSPEPPSRSPGSPATPNYRASAHPAWMTDVDQDVPPMSPVSDISEHSSSCSSDCDTPDTEPSSRSNSTRESKRLPLLARLDEELDEDSILETDHDYCASPLQASSSVISLNSGCYTPSGMLVYDVPMSKFASPTARHIFEQGQQTSSPTYAAAQRSSLSNSKSLHIGSQRRVYELPVQQVLFELP